MQSLVNLADSSGVVCGKHGALMHSHSCILCRLPVVNDEVMPYLQAREKVEFSKFQINLSVINVVRLHVYLLSGSFCLIFKRRNKR